jgi:hypothetical protein
MADDELLARFTALQHAVQERDDLERRLRQEHDAQVTELSLSACEQVLARRTGLYRCLIRHGWTPPPSVVRSLLEDEVILGESLGSAGG